MKHLTIISAAAAALLFLGACASAPRSPTRPPPPRTVTITAASGSNATFVNPPLLVGDTLIIVLNANPPQGGYAWMNAGIADSVVEQQGDAVFAPASQPGASGTVTFTFVAMRPGAQMLNLAYRRMGDRTTPLEKTYGVSVVVRE